MNRPTIFYLLEREFKLLNLETEHTYSILVADSSMTGLAFLGKFLKAEGYHVLTATSGKQAIAIAASKNPDLVLLEMSIPDMDCYEVCRSMRQNSVGSPLVVIKGIATEGSEMAKAFAAGADDFISNSRSADELLMRIRRILPEKVKTSAPTTRGSRILLVEDNELNQIYISSLVEEFGYSIEICADGLKALERISNHDFSAIIADVNIPGLNGIEMSMEIRKNISATLPIIGVSGHSERELIDRCLQSGMNEYLVKPFEPWKLKTLLGKYITGAGTSAQNESLPQPTAGNDKKYDYGIALRLSGGNTMLLEKWLSLFLKEVRTSILLLGDDDDCNKKISGSEKIFHELMNYSGYFGTEELSNYITELRAILEFTSDPARISNFHRKIRNELKEIDSFYSSISFH